MARILVVDDEVDLADYLVEALTDAGFQAGAAYNGVEAVLRVLDGGWNAVLMDVRMPKLDGINALRLIRRIAPRLPVVMFTGQAGQGDMAESMQLGAYSCLLKPLAMDKLVTVMEQATGRRT